MKTVETPRVQIVAETTVIPQLPLVKKIGVILETIEIPLSLSDVRGVVQNIVTDSVIDDLSSVGSTQQQHSNHYRKQWQQSRKGEEEEKGREERKKGRKGQRGSGQEGRKEEERNAEEQECKQVKEGRDGLDSDDEKQEAEKDGPDIRQGG